MPTLDWIGKKAILQHHRRIPLHLLEVDEARGVGAQDAGNMIVEGDNLLALKALLPYYERAVKCIYIDPPYNTGEEKWVYNDNVNAPEIRQWLNRVVGKEAEDLSRHDKWLCMMYPRLQLLKRFLAEDGAIFVSIDDNELAHLLLLMREIFGRQNEVATLVWEKGKKGDSTFFSVTHEYIVVFARNKAHLKSKLSAAKTKWRRRKAGIDEVLTTYADLRSRHPGDHKSIMREIRAWYKALPNGHPAKKHKHYNWSDDRGLYFADNFHGPDDGRESRPRYDIIHPNGKPCKKPRTGWRWEEETARAALAEEPPRIHFGPTHGTIPNIKKYLAEIDEEAFPSVFYKDGRAATKQLEALLGEDVFPFPKDVEILAELIGLIADRDDLVLDSFGGSGTTAEAVMTLNRADRGRRRFILVELSQEVAQGITARRVRQVIARETTTREQDESARDQAPLGFRYCRLGLSLFDDQGGIRAGVRYAELAAHVFFSETGVPLGEYSASSPLVGVHQGTAVYLLFNGILGDLRPVGGNVLTSAVLAALPPHAGPKVIYAERCLVSDARLGRERIVFKQTPYEIKVR